MNASQATHPTDQMLHAYGLGQLDSASARSVHSHLEGCPDCRRRIAKAEPGSQGPILSGIDGLTLLEGSAAEPAPPPASTLPPGLADHPNYQVLRELGQGGMGVVYLAQNTLMGRREVLKVVSAHLVNRKGVLDRFLGEIRNAARLHHPNIVTAYTAFRLGESLVLAMEYIEGLDLTRMVKARGPLPVAHAANYVQQAALGLQHAHEHGMVHRDIKPGNLMLTRQGNRALIKVLDFGLAKVQSEGPADGGLTHEGQMLGTPHFIAPEQISNARRADIRADIYSLGCTLYYLLTGGPPFDGTNLYDILQAHHSMEATPLNLARPDVPVELAALTAKMMAKEPERRFQTPADVAQALTPFFKKGNATASPPQSRAVSAPAQPSTESGGPALLARTVVEPAVPAAEWNSLIAFQPTERSQDEAPTTAAPSRRKPTWMWPAIVAASIFGFVMLGVIIMVITKRGRTTIELDNGKMIITSETTTPSKTATPSKTTTPSETTIPDKTPPSSGSDRSSIADSIPAGSRWVGWRHSALGAVQACELWITSRDETRFAGEITMMNVPSDSHVFRVKVQGNMVGDAVTFRSETKEGFEEEFTGTLMANEMRLKFSGTSRSGKPTQGEAVLVMNEVAAAKPLTSGERTLRKDALKPFGIVASWFAENDADGWITLNRDGTADATKNFKVDNQNRQTYWLAAWNLRNGKRWGWQAPEKFLGDHSDQFGGFLVYRIWTQKSDLPHTEVYARLTGGGKTIFVDGTTVGPLRADHWTTYSVRLDTTGRWVLRGRTSREDRPATNEDVQYILSHVTGLWIKGQYTNGTEGGSLHHVLFLGDPGSRQVR
jgi:serine/threonine protein kinase